MSVNKEKLLTEKGHNMTIKQICEKHKISQYMYYKIINDEISGGKKEHLDARKIQSIRESAS
jgi:hypothetical protein